MIFAGDIADPLIVWVGGTLIAAAIIAGAVWFRRRPFRWLWKTVVTDPVGRWFGGVIRHEVIHELEPIKTEQANIRADFAAHAQQERLDRREDLAIMREWVGKQHEDLANDLAERIDAALRVVAAAPAKDVDGLADDPDAD